MTTKAKIALIDLDGTVADYDQAMQSRMLEMMCPYEQQQYTLYGVMPDRNLSYIKSRRDAIARVPGFWSGLSVIPAGMRIVEELGRIGFKRQVLSKGPESKDDAWAEKKSWSREHLPEIGVCITEDKSNVYGRVLFDDWPEYYEAWLEHRPRGLVICLARPENEHIPTKYRDQVVRYDGSDASFEIVRKRLQAAFDRE